MKIQRDCRVLHTVSGLESGPKKLGSWWTWECASQTVASGNEKRSRSLAGGSEIHCPVPVTERGRDAKTRLVLGDGEEVAPAGDEIGDIGSRSPQQPC